MMIVILVCNYHHSKKCIWALSLSHLTNAYITEQNIFINITQHLLHLLIFFLYFLSILLLIRKANTDIY